jgi:hypothetical protein
MSAIVWTELPPEGEVIATAKHKGLDLRVTRPARGEVCWIVARRGVRLAAGLAHPLDARRRCEAVARGLASVVAGIAVEIAAAEHAQRPGNPPAVRAHLVLVADGASGALARVEIWSHAANVALDDVVCFSPVAWSGAGDSFDEAAEGLRARLRRDIGHWGHPGSPLCDAIAGLAAEGCDRVIYAVADRDERARDAAAMAGPLEAWCEECEENGAWACPKHATPDAPVSGVTRLHQPVPEVIRELRRRLAEAEAGELRGIMYVAIGQGCDDHLVGHRGTYNLAEFAMGLKLLDVELSNLVRELVHPEPTS